MPWKWLGPNDDFQAVGSPRLQDAELLLDGHGDLAGRTLAVAAL